MSTAATANRYVRIADDLRQRIAAGDFTVDGKLPAEQQLADGYGVNRLTLRKAVGLLEDDGLVTRHRGRGTFIGGPPATAAAERDTRTYVFVGQIRDHVWSEVYAALGAALQDHGQHLHCYQPTEGGAGEFGAWLRGMTPAPAIVCQHNCLELVVPAAEALACPVVVLNIAPNEESGGLPCVMPDSHRAGALAAEHLIAQGHREIAFIGFGYEPAGVPGYHLPFPRNPAYHGYLSALQAAGLPTERLAMGLYGEGEGLQDEVRAFLAHRGGWPTAFVCQQDFKARALYAVAAEQGLSIPADLSIVSLGNTPWAEALMPALTSLDLRPRAMAHLALHLLQNGGDEPPCVCRIEPVLIPRHSVAPPPSSEARHGHTH